MTPDRVPPIDPPLDVDQSLRIIVQRLQDLAHRVDFLESALLPGTSAPTAVDTARAQAARTASATLGDDLDSIEAALDTVMSSIDQHRAVPTPPPIDTIVVDLATGRREHAKPDPNRSSGWRPVATKKPSR